MNEIPPQSQATSDAVRLAMAVTRLRSRIRTESGLRSTGLPISQVAVLSRIIDEDPTTAAALAAAEHVTQQSIAQSLATLEKSGLVTKSPDPGDGRKSLVSATKAGRALVERITASREAWLSRAIEAALTPEERPALDTAIQLLQRIADVDLRVDTEPHSSVRDASAGTLAEAGNRSTTTSETP
ncbi:MAG TPA: MarR family transcriptional regulator [Solirubrobacteraceae bacterium]|jgi:DNA-binding MarR family transcriptional regulator|nr:MarR family transcriptional regulator [Solirubrobacteraceae bacterium]